jgi:hypothetical protein
MEATTMLELLMSLLSLVLQSGEGPQADKTGGGTIVIGG